MIIIRLLLTALIVIAAVFGVSYVWTTYFAYPWTRDAQVRADVVEVSSYIAGVVTEVAVVDNAAVEKGQALITIDAGDYRLAVRQADAERLQALAQARSANQEAARLTALQERDSAAISEERLVSAQLAAQSAQAAVAAAEAALARARLSLERTRIVSPVTGHVANIPVDVGDYVTAGSPIIAVVDASSFRVEAYFMETKLPAIEVGAAARIQLMASGQVMHGRVQGITRAIARGAAGADGILQNPDASFQWIRLAQRIPVQIEFDGDPGDLPLVAGATASVIIEPEAVGDDGSGASWWDEMRATMTAWLTRFG